MNAPPNKSYIVEWVGGDDYGRDEWGAGPSGQIQVEAPDQQSAVEIAIGQFEEDAKAAGNDDWNCLPGDIIGVQVVRDSPPVRYFKLGQDRKPRRERAAA